MGIFLQEFDSRMAVIPAIEPDPYGRTLCDGFYIKTDWRYVTMKSEKVFDRIFIEFCKIGERAILHVEKNGKTERIQTSVVESYSTNCTGAVTVTTKKSIYRCY